MGDWWDDFSNNLATDLAPLISLFGEQPTKQYLSECVTLLDIIIFSIAPLGIITTIVSTIRVCGNSSLRALIGRAQEGAGNAEVELCSSTSREVCELYNNGGIARVFGRPSLLEIVFDTGSTLDDFFSPRESKQAAGIYSFKGYIHKFQKEQEWYEHKKEKTDEDETGRQGAVDGTRSPQDFAPSPNLSLNIGIKSRNKVWFYAAVVLGSFFQSAVLAWTGILNPVLNLGKSKVESAYAAPMTVIGTILLSCGVGLCAYMIERSTEERVFRRPPQNETSHRARIFWIQPGPQYVGDQAFDSFIYTHDTGAFDQYTTSWRVQRSAPISHVFLGLFLTLLGYIIQFIGLRACHSSVAVAQLGLTVLMSLIRALLRTERMAEDDNLLSKGSGRLDTNQGHELAWLASYLVAESECKQWHILNPGGIKPIAPEEFDPRKREIPESFKGLLLQAAHQTHGLRLSAQDPEIESQFRRWVQNPSQVDKVTELPHLVLAVLYRARLAHLTRSWRDEHVAGRHMARNLAQPIESTTEILFTADFELKDEWSEASIISWPVPCVYGFQHQFYLTLKRKAGFSGYTSGWQIDRSSLEAIVSLWLWNLGLESSHKQENHEDDEQLCNLEKPFRRLFLPARSTLRLMEFWGTAVTPIRGNLKRESGVTQNQNSPHASRDLAVDGTNWRRLFGLFNCGVSLDKEPAFCELPSSSSPAMLCVQEIYSFFFLAMTNIIKGVGGRTQVAEHVRHFRIINTNFAQIQESFERSGLGTREDSLQCIIPALVSRKKPLWTVEDLLRLATRGGHEELAHELLDTEEIDVDAKDEKNRAALWYAASWGRQSILERLLDTGKVNHKVKDTKHGRSPIYEAAEHGHVKAVERLLREPGIEPHAKDRYNETGLFWARRNGHREVERLLVEYDSKVGKTQTRGE
ncbi:endoglucanase [Diplodia corticola]|uniref:Endoglucanase n=1 Tax=Diplodia corticola TaxID=236234 RepID=A0A1J9QLP0_9PEZI|nr:endoglucanase [Diplodia corticola]OJD29377.1 endoglucanase [Diplodia corticola]